MSSRLVLLMLLVLAGGFVMMFVEVRYMHKGVLDEYWQAWVPLIGCVLFFLMSCVLLFFRKGMNVAIFLFGAGFISGLYGSYLHSEGDVNRYIELLAVGPTVVYASDKMEREKEKEEEKAPVLAPLGLSGLCAFGMIAALGLKSTARSC
jgi:hypothetical protein